MANQFINFWLKVKAKQPLLNDPTATVTINAEQFEKLLRQAYQSGSADQASVIDELKKMGRGDSLKDLFRMFDR